MLICCNILPNIDSHSNQEITEEDGIVFVPSNQSSVKVKIRLSIEDTLAYNDPTEVFNQNSILLRLVSHNAKTEWKMVDENGNDFCLPVTNEAFQIWALEAKGYNACYPANFALLPSEFK